MTYTRFSNFTGWNILVCSLLPVGKIRTKIDPQMDSGEICTDNQLEKQKQNHHHHHPKNIGKNSFYTFSILFSSFYTPKDKFKIIKKSQICLHKFQNQKLLR